MQFRCIFGPDLLRVLHVVIDFLKKIRTKLETRYFFLCVGLHFIIGVKMYLITGKSAHNDEIQFKRWENPGPPVRSSLSPH